MRISQRLFTLLISFFCLLVLSSTGGATQELQLVAIPHPDLTGLEQVVVNQLTRGRLDVENIADNPESNDKLKALTFGKLGHLYHAYDFLDAAAAAYYNAAMLQQNVYRWNYCVAFVAQEQGDFEKALIFYKKARDQEVSTELIYLVNIRIGECYKTLNDLDSAGYAYAIARTLYPEGPAVHARLGELYFAKKEYEKAINHLALALTLQPEANKLHYPLAMAYRRLGKNDLAKHHLSLRGRVGIQPSDPLKKKLDSLLRGYRVHILEGKMAFSAERYEEAARSFVKAIGEDPNRASAWINLSAANSHLQKPKVALENLKQALKIDPENPTAHYNIGNIYLFLGEYKKSIEHLQKFITMNSEDAAAYANLAGAHRLNGQFQESVEMYKKSLRLDHTKAEVWLELITMLENLEKYELALNTTSLAAQKLPQNSKILTKLAYSLAASPSEGLRNGNKAIEISERLFQQEKNYQSARLTAMAYAQADQCNKALEWIEKAINLGNASLQNETTMQLLKRNRDHFADNRPCKIP